MEQTANNISEQILSGKTRWKRWQKVVMAMACVVVFCTIYALIIPVITVEKKTYCGMEEHIEHSLEEGCYTETLSLICGLGEDETHSHSDECYEIVREMNCEKEIHIHDLSCFSNLNADLENEDTMEKSVSKVELSGNWAEDLVNIAGSQLGYKESENNYIVDENENVNGYTRYGAWYGDEYADWSAMFVSFCVNYAGIDGKLIALDGSCDKWADALRNQNKLFEEKDYTPVAGDIVFFDMNGDEAADSTGIVTAVKTDDKDNVTSFDVIQGDYENSVQEVSYLTGDKVVIGFSPLPENPDKEIEKNEEDKENIVPADFSKEEIEDIPAAETTVVKSPDKVSGETETGDDEMHTNWAFDVYYLSTADKHNMYPLSNFKVRYQMRFNSDIDIAAGDAVIRIPAALLTTRSGGKIYPSDIAVPMGTPDDFTPARLSPFNYYIDKETDELVFFNYKDITSGSTAVWQIYFNQIDISSIIDGTKWDLPATATVKNVPVVDENGERTLVDQTYTPEHLKGRVDTYAYLTYASKTAYKSKGAIYTPELYTYKQVSSYAVGIKEEDLDFGKYVYIVWQATANVAYTQPYDLYMQDSSYIVDAEGKPLEKDGEVVRGTVIYPKPSENKKDDKYSADYPYYLGTKASSSNTQYIVTAFPKEYADKGFTLKNEVKYVLHPIDNLDFDTKASASATHAYKDYVWSYHKTTGIEQELEKGTSTPNNNAWSNIYSYRSDVSRGAGKGEDHGGLRFSVAAHTDGFLYTTDVVNDGNGNYTYVPKPNSYTPNTWIHSVVGDDYLFAAPTSSAKDIPLNNYETLTKEDYYFSSVSFSRIDRAIDFYENTYIKPLTDAYIAASGSAPVDRVTYIYAMFADNQGDGRTEDEWELVAKVPFDESGNVSYSFTKAQLAREPYRVKAEYNTVDRSDMSINVTVTIRHDSPWFNEWYGKDNDATVTLNNYCSQVLGIHYSDGRYNWVSDTIQKLSFNDKIDEDVTALSNALYPGRKPIRKMASDKLLPIGSSASASKSSSLKNDPVNGQYDISYRLEAYESYLISSTDDAAILEENGIKTPINRKHVEFYDLLPPDVQFDPTKPVKVYQTSSASQGYVSYQTSEQLTVTTKDIIQDWKGTGRNMVIFAVDYNGEDPSFCNGMYWGTGYCVEFGAYSRWEDAGAALEIPNIAAYMPVSEDKTPILGTENQVAKDDGIIVPVSLEKMCHPFSVGDINDDGETDIRNVLYMQNAYYEDMAIASNDFITKLVKADADVVDYYDVATTVDLGKGYTYKVTLTNPDDSELSDIVIFDKLENAAKDRFEQEPTMNFPEDSTLPWQGTFRGLNLSGAIAMGAAPVVYYNADRDVEIQESRTDTYNYLDEEHGWYTETRWAELGYKLADVKAFAVDLSKDVDGNSFILQAEDGEFASVSFTFNMVAPTSFPEYIYAFNNPAYSSVRNKNLSSHSASTVIGNSARVALRDSSTFEIIKSVEEAPENRGDEKFTFTVYNRENQPVTYTLYRLYDLVGDEWVEDTTRKFSTDVLGQLKLSANQKAVFFETPGANDFTVVEKVPSIYWEDTYQTEIDGARKTVICTNKWKPILYLQKNIGGISRFESADKYASETFYYMVEYKEGDEWLPAAQKDYGTVPRINTESYSVPKLTLVGKSDANGVIAVHPGSIYAIQFGEAGTEYRVTEVKFDEDNNLVLPENNAITVGDWRTEAAVKNGNLGLYGSATAITNYSLEKSIFISKALTSQNSEDCDSEFEFRILGKDGNPLSGVLWKTFDQTKDVRNDSFIAQGVTAADGKFTVKASDTIRLYLGVDTEYKVEEIHADPDYKFVSYSYDGTITSRDEKGFGFKFSLTDIDGLSTFTNDYQRRDLAFTKQVLSNDVVTEKFTMTLKKFSDETGEWQIMPGVDFVVKNSVGAVLRSVATDENGQFELSNGETAYFTEIGRIGEKFSVTETWNSSYPQLVPTTNPPENGETTGTPLEMTIKEAGGEGTIVNGDRGMVLVNKKWVGADDDAIEWIGENNDKLGVYLNVKIHKQGEEDFREPTAADNCSYLLISQDEEGAAQIVENQLTNGIIYYADPINTTLVIFSSDPEWDTTTYKISEIGFESAGEADPLSGAILSDDGEKLFHLSAVKTESSGITVSDSVASINNTVETKENTWIYKFMYGGSKPEEGAEMIWRVERYTGSGWVPAAGMEYVISYQNSVVSDPEGNVTLPEIEGGNIYKTGTDGLITLTDDAAVDTTSYELAVGFFKQVKVGVETGEVGDYRVVEVEESTDPSWGSLLTYCDNSGKFKITQIVDDPAGFVNSIQKKVLRIEKEMNPVSKGEGPFTFVLEQDLGKSKVPGDGIYFEVFDSETNEFKRSGTTTEKGEIVLTSGEYALAEVLAMSGWTITEKVGYPFEIKEINVESEGDYSLGETSVYFARPFATLEDGKSLVAHIKNASYSSSNDSKVRSIHFGYTDDYPAVISSGVTPVAVDENHKGDIELYRIPDGSYFDVYILSDYQIKANEDSSYSFYALSVLTSIVFDNYDTSKVTNMSYMIYNCQKLTTLDLSSFDTSNVTNMSSMFYYCTALTTLDLSSFDTSSVTDMSNMFYNCIALTTLDLSSFDTSSVRNMSYMFYCCSKLTTLDLSSFDTSNVTNMSGMFYYCPKLTTLDLSGFDTSKVTNMGYMFRDCSALTTLDLSSFDTSKVTNMGSMFAGCSALTTLDLSGFDTSKVTNMGNMFAYCTALTTLDLSSFDTSSVTNMSYMFNFCQKLTTLDLSSFDTSKVTNMEYMFRDCSALTTLDVSGFDTSKVTNMSSMFNSCRALTTLDLSGFDTSSVTNMAYMFCECKALTTLDLTGWSFESATDITRMFYNCSSLRQIKASRWNTAKITNFSNMFDNCQKLEEIQAVEEMDTSRATNFSYMFYNCQSLKKLDIDLWNTSNVTSMYGMFNFCYSLKKLDLNSWNVENVTNFTNMFQNCNSLEELNLESWHFNQTQSVRVSGMFQSCQRLKILNLNNWNTEKFYDLSILFSGCIALEELYISEWNVSNIASFSYMFHNCSKLRVLDVSKWDTSSATNTTYMFNGCKALEELDLSGWNTEKLSSAYYMFQGCSSLKKVNLDNWSMPSSFYGMFYGCSSLESVDFSSWKNIKKVTNLGYLFRECSSLKELDLSMFNTEALTRMSYAFYCCTSLEKIDFTGWEPTQLEYLDYTFQNCTSLKELDLSSWHTTKLYYLDYAFAGCTAMESLDLSGLGFSTIWPNDTFWHFGNEETVLNISGWPLEKMTTNSRGYSSVFNGAKMKKLIADNCTAGGNYCYLPVGQISGLKEVSAKNWVVTGNIANIFRTTYGFLNNITADKLDISGWSVRDFTDSGGIFDYIRAKEVDASGWKTDKLTKLKICSNSYIEKLNLSGWDVSKVTDMQSAFNNCTALKELDLTGWQVGAAASSINVYNTFNNCKALETIYSDDWANLGSTYATFDGCVNLSGKSEGGISYSAAKKNQQYAKTNGGYFTSPSDKP